MMKPKDSVRPFNFPAYDITVQATCTHEAEEKLHEILKTKSKEND